MCFIFLYVYSVYSELVCCRSDISVGRTALLITKRSETSIKPSENIKLRTGENPRPKSGFWVWNPSWKHYLRILRFV